MCTIVPLLEHFLHATTCTKEKNWPLAQRVALSAWHTRINVDCMHYGRSIHFELTITEHALEKQTVILMPGLVGHVQCGDCQAPSWSLSAHFISSLAKRIHCAQTLCVLFSVVIQVAAHYTWPVFLCSPAQITLFLACLEKSL